MSAITLILLLVAVVTAVAASAAARHARGLRREISGLREELLAARVAVPAARHTPALEEVRAVVADALAEERERELAEARAFWAAQEAREEEDGAPYAFSGLEYENAGHDGGPDHTGFSDYGSAVDAALLDALLGEPGPEPADGPGGDVRPFLPRQASADDLNVDDLSADALSADALDARDSAGTSGAAESEARRAARRRHPSDPNYSLSGEPVVPAQAVAPESAPGSAPHGDHDHTIERLGSLADEGTALSDVRSGPLGTLDVYVFADDTTVCLTPGHRETADRISRALDEGVTPVLLGGSGVSGAYALTFACGEETVYVLADRVIASR
ncbi:hypothetical protein JGS22_013450 [Streptomyces sp. P38-E01]|uniref:Secreted protein n=1 Tax=Streptomyces tardus TaxID=2780544 RepID=A0A949JNY3_9ACTN|nr:hypothetical protein [Streptomyces tardus]MBU7598591.1 hypothetical protein [Streptomyces tardus]